MSSIVILDSNNKDDGKIEDIDDNDDGKENNKFRGGVGDVSAESYSGGGNTYIYCWIRFLCVILFLKNWNEKSHDTH